MAFRSDPRRNPMALGARPDGNGGVKRRGRPSLWPPFSPPAAGIFFHPLRGDFSLPCGAAFGFPSGSLPFPPTAESFRHPDRPAAGRVWRTAPWMPGGEAFRDPSAAKRSPLTSAAGCAIMIAVRGEHGPGPLRKKPPSPNGGGPPSFFSVSPLTGRLRRAMMPSGRPVRASQPDGSGNSREIPPGPKGKRRLRVRGRFSLCPGRGPFFRLRPRPGASVGRGRAGRAAMPPHALPGRGGPPRRPSVRSAGGPQAQRCPQKAF